MMGDSAYVPVDAFLELARGARGGAGGESIAPGETTDAQFSKSKAIEIRDFKLNCREESRGSSSLSSGNSAKLYKFSFEISKLTDSSSPYLYYLYCQSLCKPKTGEAPSGTSLSCTEQETRDPSKIVKATVNLRKGGGQPFVFLTLRFSCVSVVSYEIAWKDPSLTESVIFQAKKCSIEYRAQEGAGGVRKQGFADIKSASRHIRGWDFSDPKKS